MGFRGIVTRSGQAFKYILDPNVDIESPSHAAQLAEIKRQLDGVKRKLDESEKKARAKDTLIAQLQEQLAAKGQEAKPAPVKKAKRPRRRRTAKKTSPATKTADEAKKPTQTRKKATPEAKRPPKPKRPPRPRESQ
jgi:small-conductance mechanosensitive channel